MTGRVLLGVVAGILALIVLCGGAAGAILGGGGSAPYNCAPQPAAPTGNTAASPTGPAATSTPPTLHPGADGQYPPQGGWSGEQVGNAAAIIAVGAELGVPSRGWVIAVATAMQESSLHNLTGGDRDSIGLFQQRPSQGWGTPAQLHDPRYAAGKFYTALLAVKGWQAMDLTVAAQRVERSAYPDAYAKWEPDATQLIAALSGTTGGLAACTVAISDQGWTQPVHGTVGSGFRTADRPGHDGVDLIVGKRTPIHAASAGIVKTVRCNAIDVRTGGEWGCDRDGDPQLTRGCGWYVDIEHPGGVVTRYCHMLVHPYVQPGQPVNVGDVIGVSGSSGHSSGPHVHFEVHVAGQPVDPVGYMASAGADLHATGR